MSHKILPSAITLFLVSFVVRGLVIVNWNFDGLYGQDSFAYYENAKVIYKTVPDFHRLRESYWPIGKAAPIGYSSAMAIFFLMMGIKPFAGQLMSLLGGSLLAAMTFLLTRKILTLEGFDETKAFSSGLIAGGIVACSGVLIKSSVVLMSDSLALCLATAVFLFILYYESTKQFLFLFLFAIATSAMIMTRYPYSFLLVPLAAYFLFSMKKERKTILHFVLAVICGFIFFLPQVFLFFQNPKSITEHTLLKGWTIANAFRTHFETVDGIQDYRFPNFLFNAAPTVHPAYLSPILFPALVFGMFIIVSHFYQRMALLLVGWVTVIYVSLVGFPVQNFRLTEAFFSPLAVFTALGLEAMRNHWNIKPSLMWIWVGMALASMLFFGSMYVNKFIEKKNADLETVQWIRNHVSPETKLIALEIAPTLRHYSSFDVVQLFYQDTSSLHNLLKNNRGTLVLNERNMETQWRGHQVHQLFHWIKDHYKVDEIGKVNHYNISSIQEKL